MLGPGQGLLLYGWPPHRGLSMSCHCRVAIPGHLAVMARSGFAGH